MLSGIIVIPLTVKGPWIEEKFSKIPANEISYKASGMSVMVKNSAGPLIYPLKEKLTVKSIHISGVFHALPRFIKGADDQALRVGLIAEGEKKLNFAQKMWAADWVKRIYHLADAHQGIDKVYFYSITQDQKLVGLARQHPLSDLIWETYFTYVETPKSFDYTILVAPARKALGIWISIDGDDTQSSYQVDINKLDLETD